MPIHDWTRIDARIFHHFRVTWIAEISRVLNAGLLPEGYYALAEQVAGQIGPDVLTLHSPGGQKHEEPTGGVALAEAPPRVAFRGTHAAGIYARRARAVVIRHRSRHDVISMVEIVSPGNKKSQRDLDAFVRKAQDAVEAGVHLLIVDLFAPTRRDPQGIHRAIWEDEQDGFELPPDKPLCCVAYVGGALGETFIEPVAVADPLPEMPLFITPDVYVPVPLDVTYRAAWEAVPALWREVLEKPTSG